jgi:hypothetical protein
MKLKKRKWLSTEDKSNNSHVSWGLTCVGQDWTDAWVRIGAEGESVYLDLSSYAGPDKPQFETEMLDRLIEQLDELRVAMTDAQDKWDICSEAKKTCD